MTDDDYTIEEAPDSAAAYTQDAPAETSRHTVGFGRWLLETAVMVALAFLLAQGIKTFVVQPFVIPTGSMEPTIMIDDRVLAEKISYHFTDPEVGDVVVFEDPAGVFPQLIKRVVAVEGQEVDVKDGQVLIDGEPFAEPYVHSNKTQPSSLSLPIRIPEGHVWLMGDNRSNSQDSRVFGPQPVTSVKGRAFAIYWPVKRIGGL